MRPLEAVQANEPAEFVEQGHYGDTDVARRIAEEAARNQVTIRQMNDAERARYAKLHPDKTEIKAGADDGLTIEEVAEKTHGDPRRAWFMAQKHQLLPNYRANALAKGVPMFSPTDIHPAYPTPPVSALPAPANDPAPRAPTNEPEPPVSGLGSYINKAVKDALSAASRAVDPLVELRCFLERMADHENKTDFKDTDSPLSDLLNSYIALNAEHYVLNLLARLANDYDSETVTPQDETIAVLLERIIRRIMQPDTDATDKAVASLADTVVKDRAALQTQVNNAGERITALARRYKRHRHEKTFTSPPVSDGPEEEDDEDD